MKKKIIALAIGILGVIAGITGASVNISIENGKYSATIQYAEEQKPAIIEGDLGENEKKTDIDGEEIITVDEIDGGKFEDATTGVSLEEGEYADLGWAETYDVSSPQAFKNDTYGKCIYANNVYGAQCVSLARVFWWSYADRDVSTCGTGMAKGMMECADQNAGDDFVVYWADKWGEIQAGDWLVFNGGQYGHVGMAMGPVVNGYVALLGENQGGRACEGGGAATNIINISVKNLIGFYRPKDYIKPAPAPEPEPVAGEINYVVVKGDSLGYILRNNGYKGNKLYGDNGLAQKVADDNGIENRNLIYPKQTIVIYPSLFTNF